MSKETWDWAIVEEGREACRKAQGIPDQATNPYPPESEEWKRWHYGWNSEVDKV